MNAAGLLDKLARQLGEDMERRPWFYVVVVSTVYLEAMAVRAAHTKLWFDEILTIYSSRLSMPAMWSFLKEGLELNPPLGHLLVGAAGAVFGRNEIGFRVPSMLAFWTMCVCLFVFLRRRVPASYAIAGMLLPMVTAAAPFAYEARPYGLLLCFAGIALVAWQAAASGRRRWLALFLIPLSLVSALCSSPMGALLFIPFAVGEAARTLKRRRIDCPLWLSFAAATPALLIPLQLKAASGAASSVQNVIGWFLPATATYVEILAPALLPLATALLIASVVAQTSRPRKDCEDRPGPDSRMPAHEIWGLLGFVLIPFAAVPLSTLGGPYWPRYSLPAVIGLSGCLILIAACDAGKKLAGGAVMAGVLFCAFLLQQIANPSQTLPGNRFNTSESVRALIETMAPHGLPIVVPLSLTFLELEYYSSPTVASDLYYLTDREAAARFAHNVHFDEKGPVLAKWFPFRAHFEDYRSFIARHKRFLVAGQDWWLLSKLLEDNAVVTLRAVAGVRYFDVTVK